jgi:hypothetical protein
MQTVTATHGTAARREYGIWKNGRRAWRLLAGTLARVGASSATCPASRYVAETSGKTRRSDGQARRATCCAGSGPVSGKRSGRHDKASRRRGFSSAPGGRREAACKWVNSGAEIRRRTACPHREVSAVIIVSLRRTPFGWNVPDNAPPCRIAAGGMMESG